MREARFFLAIAIAVFPAAPAFSQSMPSMNMPMPSATPSSKPASLLSPMPMNVPTASPPSINEAPIVHNPSRAGWPSPVHDNPTFSYFLFDQLEYQNREGVDGAYFDGEGWTGGDETRVWFKTEGFIAPNSPHDSDVEASLLYGKLVTPFYDFQAGVRVVPGVGMKPSRTYAVVGLEGVAPYNVDVEPSLFISTTGKVSARFTGELNIPLSQRWYLQPRLETNVALQPDEPVGIGAGLNNIDLGLRFRYDVWREFAPYIGISWIQDFGQTRAFALRYGPDPAEFPIDAGVRVWF